MARGLRRNLPAHLGKRISEDRMKELRPRNDAVTKYLMTPPNDPRVKELLVKVIEETQKAAGLVKPLREN